MNRLARYLLTEIAGATAFALAALLALFEFFDLVREVGRIGKGGGYTFLDALIYVLLGAPAHIYELLPLGVLIGGILSLAALSGNSELTVMRTAGVSLSRLVTWLVSIGIIFTALTFVIGEYVAPAASRMASRHKVKATNSVLIGDFQSGVWVKDGRQIINVASMLPDMTLQQIRVYEFSADMRLQRILDSERGQFTEQGWRLSQVSATRFPNGADARITVENYAQMDWQSALNPDMLAVLMIKPDEMSIMALSRYIEHLERNKQDAQRYILARWSKVFSPFSCVAMIVIALPFAMGSRRSGGVGLKIFGGIILGLGFWFLNRIMGFLGDLYNLPGWLVVAMPSLILFTGAFFAVWKKEKN